MRVANKKGKDLPPERTDGNLWFQDRNFNLRYLEERGGFALGAFRSDVLLSSGLDLYPISLKGATKIYFRRSHPTVVCITDMVTLANTDMRLIGSKENIERTLQFIRRYAERNHYEVLGSDSIR